MSLVPDPADRGPGSGNVNKVWDFRGCLSLLFDKGDKCKDLEPGEPPPAEAEEDLRRITGGTKERKSMIKLARFYQYPIFIGPPS